MKTVLWLSRHPLTDAQRANIQDLYGDDVSIVSVKYLGEKELLSEEDVQYVLNSLAEEAKELGAKAVFGVFATPIQAAIHKKGVENALNNQEGYARNGIPCFAAWNVMRTLEGGKPTFQHNRFLKVGEI